MDSLGNDDLVLGNLVNITRLFSAWLMDPGVRIFLNHGPQCDIFTVAAGDEEKFHNGEKYRVERWEKGKWSVIEEEEKERRKINNKNYDDYWEWYHSLL